MMHAPSEDDRQFLEHLWMTKGKTEPFIFIPEPDTAKLFYSDAGLVHVTRRWTSAASTLYDNDGVKYSAIGMEHDRGSHGRRRGGQFARCHRGAAIAA